jgi:integrase
MEERDIISEQEIERIINAAEGLPQKALIAMLYLTGARPSEVCLSYQRLTIWNKELQKIERVIYEGGRTGLLIKDIKIEGRDVSITLPIRKKRTKVRSEHTLVFSKKKTPYINLILEYQADKRKKFGEEDPLFDFTTRTAQRWIKTIDTRLELNGLICKLFRNTRLTKISKLAQTEEEIRQWAGHADTRSLGKYIAMRPVTNFKNMIT